MVTTRLAARFAGAFEALVGSSLMRNLLILGATLGLAVPAIALAQGGAEADPRPLYADEAYEDEPFADEAVYAGEVEYGPAAPDAPYAPTIVDPREAADMAHRMDRLVGAVMNLPIGGIMEAVNPEALYEYGPNATVRDMATRGDPDAEARIRGGIHASAAGIGAMSQALAQVMPVLQQTMQQVERDMEAAMRPYRRD